VDFDHHPPLELRNLNDEGTDYEPAQLDPDYLFALRRPCHREKTKQDLKDIAKARRRRKGPKKSRKRWPSRPFPKKREKTKWAKTLWPHQKTPRN